MEGERDEKYLAIRQDNNCQFRERAEDAYKKKYYMYCNLLRTLVGPHTRVWGLSNRDNEREQMLVNSLRG